MRYHLEFSSSVIPLYPRPTVIIERRIRAPQCSKQLCRTPATTCGTRTQLRGCGRHEPSDHRQTAWTLSGGLFKLMDVDRPQVCYVRDAELFRDRAGAGLRELPINSLPGQTGGHHDTGGQNSVAREKRRWAKCNRKE